MTRLLLAGGGHAHAQVLLDVLRRPLPAQLTVVSPGTRAPYSGMVPGWLAGTYRYDEICIDIAALARGAGARFVEGEIVALDAQRREATLADGTCVGYDWLSLNVGSTLEPPALVGPAVLALRPLGRLRAAYDALLACAGDDDISVTAVGGGAAGVESLLAVLARLRALNPRRRVAATLLAHSETLLPGLARGAARRARAALERAGVTLRLGHRFDADRDARSDLLLWAAGAVAHRWPRASALACDAAGFVRVDATLRSLSHPEVFASGDCARWAQPLPKAGVHAVRMGPVLAHNLRAAIAGEPLRRHRPQRRTLALLATADGGAIAAWGPLAAQGGWAWRWKDRIDRGFVARYRVPETG